MRWEDERYVRIYTRDTPDWDVLGWEGQALFVLLLRKVDRAGTIESGKHGLRSLAVTLAMPIDVLTRAMTLLLDDGCIEQAGSVYVIRNFIEAQEASASPAARQKESRERRRDALRAGMDPSQRETVIYFLQSEHGGAIKIGRADDLAKRLVQIQTSRPDKIVVLAAAPGTVADERALHVRFAANREKGEWFSPVGELMSLIASVAKEGSSAFSVTNRDQSPLAVPSRAVPSRAEDQELLSGKPDARLPPRALDELLPTDDRPTDRERTITEALSHWRLRAGMPKAAIEGKAGNARRRRIKARMAEGWTLERLRLVADGMTRDPFLMGTDPKSKPGGYRDVVTVFRDNDQCERLEALATGSMPTGGQSMLRPGEIPRFATRPTRQTADPDSPAMQAIFAKIDARSAPVIITQEEHDRRVAAKRAGGAE